MLLNCNFRAYNPSLIGEELAPLAVLSMGTARYVAVCNISCTTELALIARRKVQSKAGRVFLVIYIKYTYDVKTLVV